MTVLNVIDFILLKFIIAFA